jgi:hypothetical protein
VPSILIYRRIAVRVPGLVLVSAFAAAQPAMQPRGQQLKVTGYG